MLNYIRIIKYVLVLVYRSYWWWNVGGVIGVEVRSEWGDEELEIVVRDNFLEEFNYRELREVKEVVGGGYEVKGKFLF